MSSEGSNTYLELEQKLSALESVERKLEEAIKGGKKAFVNKHEKDKVALEAEINELKKKLGVDPPSPGIQSHAVQSDSGLEKKIHRLETLLVHQNWLNCSFQEVQELVEECRKERVNPFPLSEEERAWAEIQALVADIQLIRRHSGEANALTMKSVRDVLQERLNSLNTLPECVERSFGRLQILAKLKATNTDERASDLNVDYDELIQQEIAVLRTCLVKEQLQVLSQEHAIFEFCARLNREFEDDGKAFSKSIAEMLNLIQAVDLNEFFRLNAENQLVSPQMSGKDLILLLGGTGVGKSTSIHYLCGSEMGRGADDKNHIEPKTIHHSSLAQIRNCPEMKSETRYLAVAEASYLDVGILNSNSFSLCDSPGFGDTGGAAIELANCLGIVRAVKSCNSVKPVITISQQIGDRAQMLRAVARTCALMIKDMEHNISAFSFLYTKFTSDQLATLPKNVESVLNHPKDDENDPNFVMFLKHLLKQFPSEKKQHGEVVASSDALPAKDAPQALDPLDPSKRLIILKPLLVHLSDQASKVQVIARPDRVFNSFIPQDVADKLEIQLNHQEKSILQAFKESNVPLLQWKLQQLNQLAQTMPDIQFISQRRNAIFSKLTRLMKEEGKEEMKILNLLLSHGGELSPKLIFDIGTCFKRLQLNNEGGREWPQEITRAAYEQESSLKLQISQAITTVGLRMVEWMDLPVLASASITPLPDGSLTEEKYQPATPTQRNQTPDYAFMLDGAPNSISFNSTFGSELRKSQQACIVLRVTLKTLQQLEPLNLEATKLKQVLKEATTMLVSNSYEVLRGDIRTVSQMEEHLKGLDNLQSSFAGFLPELIPESAADLLKEIQLRMIDRVVKIEPILQKQMLDAREVDELSSCAKMFDDCERSCRLESILLNDQLNNFRLTLPNKIREFFGEVCKKTDLQLKKVELNSHEFRAEIVFTTFNGLKQNLEQLDVIRKVRSFESLTFVQFSELLERIRCWLYELQSMTTHHLEQMMGNPTLDFDVSKLLTGITILRNAAWFVKYRPDSRFHEALSTIQYTLKTDASQIERRIKDLDYSSRSVNGIVEAAHLLTRLEKFVRIEEAAVQRVLELDQFTTAGVAHRPVESTSASESKADESVEQLQGQPGVSVTLRVGQTQEAVKEFVKEKVSRTLRELLTIFDERQSSVVEKRNAYNSILTLQRQYQIAYPQDLLLQNTNREEPCVGKNEQVPYYQLETVENDMATLKQFIDQLTRERETEKHDQEELKQKLDALANKYYGLAKRDKKAANTFIAKEYTTAENFLKARQLNQKFLEEFDSETEKQKKQLVDQLNRAADVFHRYGYFKLKRDVELSEEQQAVLVKLNETFPLEGNAKWNLKQMEDQLSLRANELSALQKMRLQHASLKLDATIAEQALGYLSACLNISWLAEDAGRCQKNLRDFITQYRQFTHTQLENASEIFRDVAHTDIESIVLSDQISILQARLSELRRLANKEEYPNLHVHFTHNENTFLFHFWQQKMKKELRDLEDPDDGIGPGASLAELRRGLNLAKHASDLDGLLELPPHDNFTVAYKGFCKRWETTVQSEEQKCKEYLQSCDLLRFKQAFEQLDAYKAEQIRREFQHFAESLYKSTATQMKQFIVSSEEIVAQKLAANWQKASAVIQYVSSLLEEGQRTALQELLKQIPAHVNQHLKLMQDEVNFHLSTNVFDFAKAEMAIIILECWRNSFVEMSVTVDLQIDEALQTCIQSRQKAIHELNLLINRISKACDISKLALKPAAVVANLERAKSFRRARTLNCKVAQEYDGLIERIVQHIRWCLQTELTEIESNHAELETKKRALRVLQSISSDLPSTLQSFCKDTIDCKLTEFKEQDADLRGRIDQLISEDQFVEIHRLFIESGNSLSVERLIDSRLRDKVLPRAEKFREQVSMLYQLPSVERQDRLATLKHIAQALYSCCVALSSDTAPVEETVSSGSAPAEEAKSDFAPRAATLGSLVKIRECLQYPCEDANKTIEALLHIIQQPHLSGDDLDVFDHHLAELFVIEDPAYRALPATWPVNWDEKVKEAKKCLIEYFLVPYRSFDALSAEAILNSSAICDVLDEIRSFESKSNLTAFLERNVIQEASRQKVRADGFAQLCFRIQNRITEIGNNITSIAFGNDAAYSESKEDIMKKIETVNGNVAVLNGTVDLRKYCSINGAIQGNPVDDARARLTDSLTNLSAQAVNFVNSLSMSKYLYYYANCSPLSYYLLTITLMEKHIVLLASNGEVVQRIIKAVVGLLNHAWESVFSRSTYFHAVDSDIRFRDLLVHTQIMANNVESLRPHIKDAMSSWLSSYVGSHGVKGHVALAKLAQLLQANGANGAQVIDEHTCFQGVQQSQFQKRIAQKKLPEVLHELDGTGMSRGDPDQLANKQRLEQCYQSFEQEYQTLITKYNTKEVNWELISPLVVQLASKISLENRTAGSFTWTEAEEKSMISLLAHIFAVWTLDNNSLYWNADGVDERDNYLVTPHATQVLGIMCMLGIGQVTLLFRNNLVEIGTGEGKSITLAIVSAVLALIGANVNCACYSKYLSERDYASFTSLFKRLEVLPFIRYGTFNKICEQWIERQLHGGSIRSVVEKVITDCVIDASIGGSGSASTATSEPQAVSSTSSSTPSASASSSSSIASSSSSVSPVLPRASTDSVQSRTEILLIDEVDVFLDQSFYGSMYPIQACLRHPSIRAVTDLIWKKFKQSKTRVRYVSIQNSAEVKSLIAAFPKWEKLVENAVRDMAAQVATFKTPAYAVIDGVIKYRLDDAYSSDVVYGYHTLFAHYFERDAGRVQEQQLSNAVFIGVNCCAFSYAAFPSAFQFILGVTGTLKVLSDEEKKTLEEEYGIHKHTFAASMYNKQKINWNKAITLCDTVEEYYREIANQVRQQLGRNGNGFERAVIVVLETETELEQFRNSRSLDCLKLPPGHIRYLSEQTEDVDKKDFIRVSTQQNHVTIITSSFGRGTDFIVKDPIVANNGGVHVMQCFFSKQFSQEIQIQGRTCRQGEVGSYNMILLKSQIEPFFSFEREKFQSLQQVDFADLHRRRQALFDQEYKAQRGRAAKCKSEHQQAMDFLKDVIARDVPRILTQLNDRNIGAADELLSRTLILIDATGSMSAVLDGAKSCAREMLDRVCSILQEHKLPSKAFEVQFAMYRNYGCGFDTLLEASSWESSPGALQPFLDDQKPRGGQRREAIEIGLQYANQQHLLDPISQVVLIGDAPPNTADDVKEKRASYRDGFLLGWWNGLSGEAYWSKTPYPQPTLWSTECAQLKQSGVPVHTFWLKHANWAENDMKQIAASTGGQCRVLDVSTPSSGAQVLTDVCATSILSAVNSNQVKGDQLVAAYKKKYDIKGFVA